jgi:hypothetical protein
VSSFRPPSRSGWRAPWISGVLAVLVAAVLAGAGAAAGAQEGQPPDAGSANATPAGSDPSAQQDPAGAQQDPAPADQTTTTAADGTSTTAADQTTTTAADQTTTTAADQTTTTAADAGGAAADPNGNINNLPLNDGVQRGTVFNDVPYGEIPANTPQILVLRPGSGRIIPLNREINIRARFANFTPGFFSDPASEYGEGTQRLDQGGNLQGHNHACVQRVARNGAVPNERCDSFVVLQQEGTSDILTGIGPPLTTPGRYRVCVDTAAENHYPAARAFAQRGGPVDCVRVLALDFSQLRGQPVAAP